MYIFLDIDGVLNQLQMNYYLDTNCIKQLGNLCHTLGAEVVLTSTWKTGYTHSYERCTPQVQKLIDLFRQNNIVIESRTRTVQGGNRADEIQEYVERNQIKDYIILDDDKSLFGNYTKGLYMVNPSHGLTAGDVKKIVKMWKKKQNG